MSSRMTSTTVYLTQEQQKRLDEVGSRIRVPKAVLIRQGIDLALAQHSAPLTGGVQEGDHVDP